MRTYRPDQWLRLWFVGGPSEVDYSNDLSGQLAHRSPGVFANQLRAVWRNCALASGSSTRMVVRFGAIHDRHTDAVKLLSESLLGTRWRVNEIVPAGSAALGRRQALHFGTRAPGNPLVEHDFWLSL